MLKWSLLIALAVGCLVRAQELSVAVSAKSAILINAETGKILYAKQPYQRLAPASTTKIASCLFALKKIEDWDAKVVSPLECLIKISKKIKIQNHYEDPAYRLEPDGVSYGICQGEILSVRDLVYGMMLISANDPSNVLAYHLSGGDIPSYMEEMNEYLKSLGCTNTKFYNPHGLHHPKHLTTALDLALMAKEAIKVPKFLEIVQTHSYERPKTNKQAGRTIFNTNALLKKGPLFYPKAFGLKSGYHEVAKYNFVGAAKDNDRVLISVVMNCPSLQDAYKDTIRMFEAAFSEKKLSRQLLNHQEVLFTHKVKHSRKKLRAGIIEDLVIEYFSSEEEELAPFLQWEKLTLPIKKGDLVAYLEVRNTKNRILKKHPVYALNEIPLSWVKRNWRALISHQTKWGFYYLSLILISWICIFFFKKRVKREQLL